MYFFILILYPSALLNSFINSNSSLVETLEFCIYHVIWNSDSLTSSLPVWILFISFPCLASVTRTSSQSVSSVAQSHLTLCNPMDCIMRGFPVHHQLLELAQTHVHRVGDAIQPSHPLSSASPPAFNLCQSWALKNWCFWTVVLEDSWESLGQQGDQTRPS